MFDTKWQYKLYVPLNAKVKDEVEDTLTKAFEGWTRYRAQGAWQNLKENVFVYEVVSDQCMDCIFIDTIEDIMHKAGEEEVLWTVTPIQIGRKV